MGILASIVAAQTTMRLEEEKRKAKNEDTKFPPQVLNLRSPKSTEAPQDSDIIFLLLELQDSV